MLDTKSMSPLHLAVKEYGNNRHRSSKPIKILLIKGANRDVLDFENKRPIDYLREGDESELAEEIRKLLTEE